MTHLPKIILMVALGWPFTMASAQLADFTGEWSGTVTTSGFIPTGTFPVSAHITQSGNAVTATVVGCCPDGVPMIFTETGFISGSTISFSDNDATVSATFSSTSAGLKISGSGNPHDPSEQWTGTLSSDGKHMSGTATDSKGASLTFTLVNSPSPCTLSDTLTYNATSSTLTMKFTIGNNLGTTAIWNAWLTYADPQGTDPDTMQLLFSILQPITNPPKAITKTVGLPKEGTVGVLSTLSTPHLSTAKTEGIACSSWVRINTGTEP